MPEQLRTLRTRVPRALHELPHPLLHLELKHPVLRLLDGGERRVELLEAAADLRRPLLLERLELAQLREDLRLVALPEPRRSRSRHRARARLR